MRCANQSDLNPPPWTDPPENQTRRSEKMLNAPPQSADPRRHHPENSPSHPRLHVYPPALDMNLTAFAILAQAAPAGQPPEPNLFVSMMPLIFIFIIFYFLLIRPQQKKAKEHAKLIEAIKTGDQVVTSAGIHGTVANVKEKTFVIKIADNVKVEFDRAAVASVVKSADAAS